MHGQQNVKCSLTTHTEYIVVFSLQQWCHERTTVLRYMYVAYLLQVLMILNHTLLCAIPVVRVTNREII